MLKFFKKLAEKVSQLNNLISDYKSVTKDVVIPSKAYVNWGIYLANTGEVEQAVEKFESSAYMSPRTPESYNNWGIALATKGQYKEAINKFREAIKIDSGCVKSYALWGAALVETGDFEEAEKLYQKALSLNGKNAEVYVNWGIALARQNKKQLAETKFRKAVNLSPRSHQAIFLWGVVLVELERYDEAIEKFSQSLKINPHNPDAFHYWSVCLLKKKQLPEAFEKGKTALDMIPSKIDFQINIAEILTETKKYDQAENYYIIAETTHPDNAQLFCSWGQSLQKRNEHQTAIEKFNRSLEINPKQIQTMYHLAISLAETGEIDKAEETLKRVIEKDSRFVDAYIKLGTLATIKGNLLLAIENYKEAAKFSLKKTEANYLIASAYSTLSDYQASLEYYQKAIESDAKHLDSYVGYAVALNEMGNTKEAVRKIRNAYRMAPDSAQICMIYGIILSGDEKTAKDSIEKFNAALQINADLLPALVGKGEALIKLNRFEEALSVCNEALLKNPDFIPVLFLTGGTCVEICDSNNDMDYLPKAEEYFRRVLAIEPNHVESLANLAYIKAKYGYFEAFENEYRRLIHEFPEQRELISVYLNKSLEKLNYGKNFDAIIG